MARRIAVALLLLVILTTKSFANDLGYSKFHPLIFGVDIDYAPLEYVEKDGIPRGLDVDFTHELMKRLNIPLTYRPNTWENIADDIIDGRVDLGMMVYSPYRKNITNYSRPIFRLYYQIVFRKNDKNTIDTRDLRGKHIAYMASTPVSEMLTKMKAYPHVVIDLPQAMRALSAGEYDAIICFRYQALYLIEQFGLVNLIQENLTLEPREYCYVSHSKPLIEAINAELIKMESEGVIIDIYGNTIPSVKTSFSIPVWLWYTLAALIFVFLLIIIILQRRSRKHLRHEMERAQNNEQQAQRNEQRALQSEQIAIRNRQRAEEAMKEARRSEQLKTVFLANVSHALRTPLNAIIGFSDLIRTDTNNMLDSNDRQQLIESIYQNGQQLLYFINELIQLSAIEGNNIKFEHSRIDMNALMNEFRSAILPYVKEGVNVYIEGPKQLYPILDANQMRIVASHMLRNAAKHTEKGHIIIRYRREMGTDTDGHKRDGLRIEVIDTGGGVPQELRDNIFNLLSDKNTFLQNDMPGLGLSICASIVRAAKGHLRLETETGIGSTFINWVPCEFA